MAEIKGADWLVQLEGATLTTAPASDAEAIAKVATDVAVTPANLAAIGASATFAGLVELATDAETITGSATDRAVTPANIQAKVATATAKGIVELATSAEVIAGSDTDRATTAAGVHAKLIKFNFLSFTGSSSSGACSIAGVKVSDLVVSVTGVVAADNGDQSALFESVITVADQIQQVSTGNLSSKQYLAAILRKS